MELMDFEKEMKRVLDTFGERFFPEERVKMIWSFSKDMESKNFKNVIDTIIAEWPINRPPVPADFMKQVEEEKKRFWNVPISEWKNDFVERPQDSIFSKEDIAEFFNVIRAIISGKVSKADQKKYVEMTMTSIFNSPNRPKCLDCDDEGVLFDEDKFIFKCRCPKGLLRKENFPLWNREPIKTLEEWIHRHRRIYSN